ncbi:DODA-type extradiol aromatic ring-opening family dioxygenase [Lichenicoccus sp.]|uniref:DODA-type extradiol aromatic ring-opening family dioxygenase n=1 Tax=Lichenicoccus sp. TaxID=2781899 RepID=UPI003D13636C
MTTETIHRQPVLALPHGGGPCFVSTYPAPLEPAVWASLGRFLRDQGAAIRPRPRAVLVISGHWEEAVPTVTTAVETSLYYDYYGFAPEAYALHWPVKGAPDVARRVRKLLADAGIASAEDAGRGLDHGVFVPLMEMFPDADIQIVQLSLQRDLNPAAHLAIGRALAPLRDEGILIIGSGSTFHNAREVMPSERSAQAARTFGAWVAEVMAERLPERRFARLADWQSGPDARFNHPKEEHLLPYHVAAGAGGDDPGATIFDDLVAHKAQYAFRFG